MTSILDLVPSQNVEGMTLFGYQERILDALRDAFREGHRAVCLVAPTGAGKTEMAIELLGAVANKGNRGAMVLDRVILCEQTSQRLDKYGIDHGVMQAGHWRFRADRHIQVCSAQTLEKRGSLPGMRLLIVDECHQPRKQITKFMKNNSTKILAVGLTATPFTKGLGQIYTKAVSAVSTRELVDAGRLAPLRVYIAKEVDMTGAKKVAGEWSTNEAEARSMAITGDVVSEWVKKTNEIFGGPRKTVVFASGVKHAADLAQQFNEAGYNFVSLSYKDDDDFKADAIREFSKPDTAIQGLIATDILTKGFDVPDVMVGVSARPFSKSLASHVQQMGRVMRSNPGKEFGLWLDHSGNYLRFREDWEEIYENGITEIDDGREKPKKEKTAKEKEAAKCPCCSRLWPARSNICPSCGFVRAMKSDVVTIPGELEELTPGKGSAPKAVKQDWYSQLKTIASQRGYSDGWVAHKYREKFGVWPKSLNDMLMPVSLEVAGWVRSRQIAWAKGRKAA